MIKSRMSNSRIRKNGAEESGDYHRVFVELVPVAMCVVIALILGLLLLLFAQHQHIMKLLTELANR